MLPTFLPDPTCLQLTNLTATPNGVTMEVKTTSTSASCPACGQVSRHVHSRYRPTLADLPWCGSAVQLWLWTRRLFCRNQQCGRRIFTERLPTVVEPYGRRTLRLGAWLTHVAFALGGDPGARLLHVLGIRLSGDTLLAYISRLRRAPSPTPRVLSVDDFAFRRGRRYGTILVDLERHQPVDLLADRSTATFAAWLRSHPGVEVISRDRSSEYAEAARHGAPCAIQVADRFHLIRNVGDVTRRVFQRSAAVIQRIPIPSPDRLELSRKRLDRAASKEQTRAAMRDRFQRIHALAAEGLSKEAIARRLELNRQTVYKYLALTAPPERCHICRAETAIAPYEGYLLRRWLDGCHNARALWREIGTQGYGGSYRNVARITGYLKQQERAGSHFPLAPAGLTPRQAVGLLLPHPEDRTEAEAHTVELLGAIDTQVAQATDLCAAFLHLVREAPYDTPGVPLEHWLREVERAGIPEFTAFVTKLRQDLDAVLAGLHLPWSQGQTEGQVNRLKTIKRTMYGRASFDLLRQRVLYDSW